MDLINPELPVSGSSANDVAADGDIIASTVSTPDIRNDAVHETEHQLTFANAYATATLIDTQAHTFYGRPALIMFNAEFQMQSRADGVCIVYFQIKYDGAQVWETSVYLNALVASAYQRFPVAGSWLLPAGFAGAHTITVYYTINAGSNGSVPNHNLIILDLKK